MYRPIGIFLTYVFYELFNNYLEIFYSINILLYFTCALQLYLLIKIIDKNMAVFVSFCFIVFPLNVTAYLQIPSLMMIIGINGFLLFLRFWIYCIKKKYNFGLLLCVFFWFLLLFVYEQIVSLTLIPVIIIYYINNQRNDPILKYFKIVFLFVLLTIIFVLSYVFTSQNPKIISLIKINKNEVTYSNVSTNDINISKQKNDKVSKIIKEKISFEITNKFTEANLKLNKFFDYYNKGIVYAYEKLLKSKLIILIVFAFILFCISFLLSKSQHRYYKKELVYISLFGFFWFVSSLTPFLLYTGIKIPPYVFVLPSIGFSIFCFGIFKYIVNSLKLILIRQFFKIIISLLFLSCFLNQIGYYYGIREEFVYWDKINSLESFDVNMLLEKKYIEINKNIKKENNHIFWLEKFVGARYLQNKIGNNISTPIITSNKKSIKIKIQ